MRNSGRVPGTAHQGACEETVCVVDKIDNDHFNGFQRKPVENGWEYFCTKKSSPATRSLRLTFDRTESGGDLTMKM